MEEINSLMSEVFETLFNQAIEKRHQIESHMQTVRIDNRESPVNLPCLVNCLSDNRDKHWQIHWRLNEGPVDLLHLFGSLWGKEIGNPSSFHVILPIASFASKYCICILNLTIYSFISSLFQFIYLALMLQGMIPPSNRLTCPKCFCTCIGRCCSETLKTWQLILMQLTLLSWIAF